MSGTVYIIGAGLAGLSCAVRLADEGKRVAIYEAARMAGGRCRSYFDATLDLVIDNGNHLLLSGNMAARDYGARIGASDALVGPEECEFDFLDYGTGQRWKLRPNASQIPWWIFFADRRVPGTGPLDYLDAGRLLFAKNGATIGETMRCEGSLWEKLWRPVMLSALNIEPSVASATLAGAVLRETLAAGGSACRPLVAKGGLGHAFIEPALRKLRSQGIEPRFGARLKEIVFDGARVAGLRFSDEEIAVETEDRVVLAAPAWIAQELVPGLVAPDDHRAILNVHFKIAPPAGQSLLLGMVGALSEWLFAFEDRLSVTISGADRLMDAPREELAAKIWEEVATAAGLTCGLPAWQIVKEKRATFAATPAQEARRPQAKTQWGNLFLAGDWTATGLPATIEGSIRSGYKAAGLAAAEKASPV
ncbi:hydroxysqualene dehydroxylase HpnE [Methylocystis parvus]|uniref:NAD(P)-binding protein n=1 Tax=Methylocystis parvus TaxID=134 RepID=A0A6B8M4V5_9HYPH|nr:hydroxysqualene dehydroxylase HpnE [Methylocystis parvus]QGM97961.1 NAD(P)-binding protein [Methylocystis parvus]WBK01725.1 hydroxysqualene dehydroxylase HpnE [Methylocystis parvus OBBP]